MSSSPGSSRELTDDDLKVGKDFEARGQSVLYQRWNSFVFHGKTEKDFLLIITSLRFVQVKVGVLGRRVIRKNVPISNLEELSVAEHDKVATVRLYFHGDDEEFELPCSPLVATQIVQSVLWASQTITCGYPVEALPKTDLIPPKFLSGMPELRKKRPKEVLAFAYVVACDELNILERPSVSLGLTQSAETLDIRRLFFPEASPREVLNQHIPHAEIIALSIALRFTQCFDEVVSHGVPIADDGLKSLARVIFSNASFQSVSFVDCKLTGPSAMKTIATELKTYRPRLSLLNMSSNPRISDAGIQYLCVGLGKVKVDQLYLSKCAFGSKGFKALAKALESKHLVDHIKVLDLSENQARSSGSAALAQWLTKCMALEVLSLVRSEINVDTVLSGIEQNSTLAFATLRHLNISECRMTDGGAKVLGDILASTNSLSRVFMRSTRMSGKQFKSIMAGACANPSAKTGTGVQFVLDFQSNNLDNHAGEVLGQLLTSPVRSIKNLVLSHNHLKESGIASVCKAVQNLKTLKCLVLDKNVKPGIISATDEVLGESVARLCRGLPSLETLSISGADDAYNVKNGLNPLLESLATNNTLTRLTMSRNKFGNAEFELLAKAMETNKTLRVLDVDHNRAGASGLSAFINSVKTSTILFEALPTNDVERLLQTKDKQLQAKLLYGRDETRHRLEANRKRASHAELRQAGLLQDVDGDEDGEGQARERTPSEVERDLERQRGDQFGVDVIDLVGSKKARYLKARIPTVLVNMQAYLEDHDGLNTVGIFRLAPDKDESARVERELNDSTFTECSDVNSIANCLKIWFRKLPTPLFEGINADAVEEVSVDVIGERIHTLFSEPTLSLFLWLLDLSVNVARNEEVNKMSSKNLAIVWVPNLFLYSAANPLISLQMSEKFQRFFETAVDWRKKWRDAKDEEERLAREEQKDNATHANGNREFSESNSTNDASASSASAAFSRGGGYRGGADGRGDEADEDEDSDSDDEVANGGNAEQARARIETKRRVFEEERRSNLNELKATIKKLKREQIRVTSEIQMLELEDDESVEERIEELNHLLAQLRTQIAFTQQRQKEEKEREFEIPEYDSDSDSDYDTSGEHPPAGVALSRAGGVGGRPPVGRLKKAATSSGSAPAPLRRMLSKETLKRGVTNSIMRELTSGGRERHDSEAVDLAVMFGGYPQQSNGPAVLHDTVGGTRPTSSSVGGAPSAAAGGIGGVSSRDVIRPMGIGRGGAIIFGTGGGGAGRRPPPPPPPGRHAVGSGQRAATSYMSRGPPPPGRRKSFARQPPPPARTGQHGGQPAPPREPPPGTSSGHHRPPPPGARRLLPVPGGGFQPPRPPGGGSSQSSPSNSNSASSKSAPQTPRHQIPAHLLRTPTRIDTGSSSGSGAGSVHRLTQIAEEDDAGAAAGSASASASAPSGGAGSAKKTKPMVSIFEQIDVLKQYEDFDSAAGSVLAVAGGGAGRDGSGGKGGGKKRGSKLKVKRGSAPEGGVGGLPWNALHASDGTTRTRSNSDRAGNDVAGTSAISSPKNVRTYGGLGGGGPSAGLQKIMTTTAVAAAAASAGNKKRGSGVSAAAQLMDWGDMLSKSPTEVLGGGDDDSSPRRAAAPGGKLKLKSRPKGGGGGVKRVAAAAEDDDTSDVHSDFIRSILDAKNKEQLVVDDEDENKPRWISPKSSPRSSQ